MALSRRLLVLAAAAGGAAVLAQPSFAARPSLPFSLDSAGGHFTVHYQSDLSDKATKDWAITATEAGDVAALAERAYTKELADGYPAPLDDGDGRYDIYVEDLDGDGDLEACNDPAAPLGVAITDTGNQQSSGYIELNACTELRSLGLDQHTIAHELFHLIQFAIWVPTPVSDYWLLESSAEWMGFRADAYGIGNGLGLGPSEMSLDCRDPLGTNRCDLSGYLNNGYSRWAFFEYVTERFGASFVKEIFAQGAAGAGTATQALAATLAAHGTTLADAFDDWTAKDMQSAYAPALLQGHPPTPYTTVQTGRAAGTVASLSVPVNHLSARYVEFDRGGGAADAAKPCFAATLHVTVTMPAGTSSKPLFWWAAAGSSPLALSVSGSTASAAIPWDTCTWSGTAGFLALPNASTGVDAADFQVSATMTVDTTTPATATAPPPQASTYGQVIPVTSAETAPVLTAFGPEVLRVSATTASVRLIVQADQEGSVRATLGSISLGSVSIRPGNNDVRFALPKGIRLTLRRSAATAKLVLTPVSAQGNVVGAPVLRTLRVEPAKAKTKAKTKAKRRHRRSK